MNGSAVRSPPESGGHQNAAYEADVDNVDPVMQDQVDGKSQKLSTQNGGQDNAAFQSDDYVEPAPRIPDIQHSNTGYLDLDENSRHKYQGLTQNGASNHRPSEKNGSIDDHKYYDIDLGTEANEYENTDFLRHKGEQNQPYGFNSPASYKFKGKTEHEENEAKKRQTCSKGTCFIVIFFILLLAALIGVAVFLLFEFVFNKPPQVTTTRPTHMVTTVAVPEPSYNVISSAVATIDMPYNSSLDNSSSPEYKALESSFSNLMNDAFSNSDISGTYEGVIVNGFSPGSILVHFDILITIDQGELPNAPPNGDPAQEIAYVAAEVEAQVTNVLVAVSMDNSSSLPIAAVNVTGTSAELLEMTTERETTYQPTTTEQEMTTQLATTQETTESPDRTTAIPSTTQTEITEYETSTRMETSTQENAVNCTLFDYLCLDGTQCIPYSQYCDGLIDCNDGSDEPSFCSLAPCNYTTEYACDDQTQCYPHYKFCDGVLDCNDGSDESFCSTCNGTDLPCSNSAQCYPFEKTCDGVLDCINGADEELCLICNGTDQLCVDYTQCYPADNVCDGVEDCIDGSDEWFCTTPCEDDELNCFDQTQCYPAVKHCDGVQDCTDGSDEGYCPTCSDEELQCVYSLECYSMDKLCDGVSDCLDQSDESNCTEGGNQTIYLREHPNGYNLTSPNYPEYYPLNAQRTWLIVAEDGFRPRVDVLDLYTEPNLDVLYLSSSPTEAPLVLSGALTRTSTITYLSSNESLYARFVSDFAVSARGFLAIVTSESANNALACMSGQYDCGDGSVCMPSDQKCSCPVQPASCTTPTDCFPCNSGKCLPFSQQCDGTRQCEFGEDERNCTIQCNQFLCFEGICIDNSSICDMVNDCVNGEDEFGCNYPVGEENVTLSEGDVIEITSLGYPAVYDNNVYYTWILHAASARKVHIKFLQFRTHDANDFVLIGDGAVAGSNPFLRLYGSAFVPDKIVSQSTSLWITMVTDESFVSDGFRANVSTVPSSYTLGQCADSAMRCGDQVCVSAENLCDILPHCVLPDFDPGCPARIELGGIGSQHVSITSPFLSLFSENFPGKYGSLIDATLYLTAPAGQGVLVALRQFDVEGDYDFVRIYEGHGRENLLATLTGLVANQVIVSTGNEITIVFESDEIQAYFGFWMEIEAKDTSGCADDEFSCSNGQCRPASVECNGLIDCIDFTDEELCPTCSSVPSECSNILPWNITIFPNARFASEAEAIQYYADVTPSFNCHASARFLACAAAFPECPYYGNTRTVCLSVCDDVLGGGCEALQDVVDGCSGDTVVETVDGTVLCEARGGDLFNTSICGTRPAYDGDGDFQARIIGGTHAQAGEFPWLGSLRNQGDHICGATLVNERWAITAAHCTGEYDEIVFGDLKIDVASNYTASPTIARIRDHPQYVSTFEGDDISLIEFSAPIVFSEYVRPICLPMPNVSETMAYRRCYAAGWGATVYEAGTTNNELLKVLLPLMENDECSRNYENIIPSKICAGYRGGGYDACQGDSGGPLACEGDDGRWHLVGITSYGNQGCGDPGYPGVYTRVSSYLGFIQQSIS